MSDDIDENAEGPLEDDINENANETLEEEILIDDVLIKEVLTKETYERRLHERWRKAAAVSPFSVHAWIRGCSGASLATRPP